MAIEEYGKSLLADVRKRKDDEARKARKREEKNALTAFAIKGAVSIGNSMLKDKANVFLESEQFMRENMEFKKGYNISNDVLTQEKLARDNKLGYDAYWSNVAPEATVSEAMTQKHGEAKKYSAGDWKEHRSTLMKEIGAEARKQHELGLKDAQAFINSTGSEGSEFYSNYAKKSRPSSIKDLIVNKTKSIFGGQDLNAASREIKRKEYLGKAQALIAYDDAYEKSGNSRMSSYFAEVTDALGAAAPVVKEEFMDMGTEDGFGNAVGKEKVFLATYWDGSERYLNANGDSMTKRTLDLTKQLTTFVGRNSGTGAAATAVQGVGAEVLTAYQTDEEKEFLEDRIETSSKGLSGPPKQKVMEQTTRNIQANIAGLKIIFTDTYGLSEQAASRLAVVMYKSNLERIEENRDSSVIGVNVYNHGNVLGVGLSMAKQQSNPKRPRDFRDDRVAKVFNSSRAKKLMFDDYLELTPRGLESYDAEVKASGNPEVKKAHERTKGFLAVAKANPKLKTLPEIEAKYYKDLAELPSAGTVIVPPVIGTSAPVVPEIVPLSKLIKPTAAPSSRGSSYLNPVSGRRARQQAPTQLDAYNKLLALQAVAQKKKARADESTAALKPQFKNQIGTPQKASIKAITELEKAYEDYITTYGE